MKDYSTGTVIDSRFSLKNKLCRHRTIVKVFLQIEYLIQFYISCQNYFTAAVILYNWQKVVNPGINISCIQFVAGDTKNTCVQFVRSIVETAKQTKVGKIYVSFFLTLMKIKKYGKIWDFPEMCLCCRPSAVTQSTQLKD